MVEFLLNPWPWWFSGVLIGLTVPLLYVLAGRAFGISTSLQEIGAICAPGKLDYLRKHRRRSGIWTVVLALGIVSGGAIGAHVLSAEPIEFLPDSFRSTGGAVRLLIGGVLVGFGTRYAGGCTSGHSITGISNLNGPSLVATICFFAGGLAVTWGLGALLLGGPS